MFLNKFVGTGSNSVIQRITELTKTEKGEIVLMHLLADLVGDGVQGDNEREGNEEEMLSYTDQITIDLISHGVRQKGKLADQKTVVNFRQNARDILSYWLGNRMDQLGFLTLSGIAYSFGNDGSTRTDSAFADLAFASDVSAPTSNRHVNLAGTASGYTGLVAGNTATIDQYSTFTYESIVDLGVYADTNYVKPLMANGREYYVLLVRPEAMAQLKKDADFQRAVVTGLPRSDNNPFFTGGVTTVDGLVIHEHRLVYNTKGAASGSKWGSGSTQDGSRALLCGSQAMGMSDLGSPEWAEKWFQYNSSPGINVDKMFGLLKPKFNTIYSNTVEDFGVVAVNHAI